MHYHYKPSVCRTWRIVSLTWIRYTGRCPGTLISPSLRLHHLSDCECSASRGQGRNLIGSSADERNDETCGGQGDSQRPQIDSFHLFLVVGELPRQQKVVSQRL